MYKGKICFIGPKDKNFSPVSKAEEIFLSSGRANHTCMLLKSESATVWLDLSPQMQGLFCKENYFFHASSPSVVSIQPKSNKT